MKILPSGAVLEVGTGEGHFLCALNPGRYEVVGVEASAEAAATARRRIADRGLRGGVRQGSLHDAGLPAETFDLIALFGSLGGAGSPRAICMEVARLLRSGGYAVIETPSLSSLTALLCGTRWRPLRDPHSDYFFSPACLDRLLSSCGLSPGVARMPVPVGWPSPGNLVYITRKSSIAIRATSLTDLASNVGNIAPMGAAH
ncbi:MAG TPA: methyltransferase domain-containing protein [Patescibacteria group bacterium]|nr:methyltransferase domain-containing protein [Patescibacteria group bacterium]